MDATLQSSEPHIRPRWVSAIVIWHFGWFAILLLFLCLMYSGAVHLNPGPRARLDNAVTHIQVSTYLLTLTNLIGSGLLFYLRKAAFYAFCTGLAIRSTTALLHVLNGSTHGLNGIWQIVSLLVGTIFCLYARSLMVNGILK